MRVVLDTNVLAAAFFSTGTCSEIYQICVAGHSLLRSERLVDELRKTLAGKMKVPIARVESNLEEFAASSLLIVPESIPVSACRDPRDLHILGLAVGGAADLVVSGDDDLLVLGSFRGIPILKPRDSMRDLIVNPGKNPPTGPDRQSGGFTVGERRQRYGARRRLG